MQDRLILTGVQMPPSAFGLMVVERARLAALRTVPLRTRLMHQMNVNFPISHLQLNAVHSPGGLNPQNLGIQFVILHLPIINSPTQIPDEPFLWTASALSFASAHSNRSLSRRDIKNNLRRASVGDS